MAGVPDQLAPARANPEKLQRVLFNLIQNAIRHTPADGSVVVRAEPVAAGIEVEIADTGDGIAPEERERVFTAFYRGGADAARTGDGAGPRSRGLARDRRGSRGPDLARGLEQRHERALQSARGLTWHKHDEHDEFFLVLDGQLLIDLEDREAVARSREAHG